MKIAMSGATGFVGGNLISRFIYKGWEVIPIRREHLKDNKEALINRLKDAEAVINMAGAPVIAKWTEEYKKAMYSSRIDTTRKIVDAMSTLEKKPKVFISTSAIGIYKTDGTHTEEESVLADNFLGKMAYDWEQAALKAKELGIRTAIFRFGIVLGRDGGALHQMIPFFKLGLGGTIGDGSQTFCWIHIEDLANAYMIVIENEQYDGIYNLTAPNPTTNMELTKILGRVLHRPAIFRVPSFALKMKFGEGAQIFTLGPRALPKRLLESGFTFRFSEIEEAIKDCVT